MNTSIKRILSGVALAWAISPMMAFGQVTYSWTAEDGETIYAPTPPSKGGQPYVMLKDGRVVKRFDRSERHQRPETDYIREQNEAQQRQRRDALLLVEFPTLDHVDRALESELDTLGYDFNLVDSSYNSLHRSLLQQIGFAADRQRAGLPVQTHELQRIESIRSRMGNNREDRLELEARKLALQEEYEGKKARLRELLDRQAR